MLGQDLDGDGAIQASITSFIHLAHAPGAEGRLDLVGAEEGDWCQRHGVRWMCEAGYEPGRGLLGEVHAGEQVLECATWPTAGSSKRGWRSRRGFRRTCGISRIILRHAPLFFGQVFSQAAAILNA